MPRHGPFPVGVCGKGQPRGCLLMWLEAWASTSCTGSLDTDSQVDVFPWESTSLQAERRTPEARGTSGLRSKGVFLSSCVFPWPRESLGPGSAPRGQPLSVDTIYTDCFSSIFFCFSLQIT